MIRVLVVDDSAVVRKVLTEELSRTGDIQVVGTAIDPYAARERIAELDPDVLTLDIEMPRMDGLSFLAKLMRHHPMPVVVVSSVTPENGETALEALRLGAVEVIPKPGSQFSVPDVRRHLARAIRAAARARLAPADSRYNPSPGGNTGSPVRHQSGLAGVNTTHKLVALGASTGGTRALEEILRELPPDVPGIAIVQHMPSGFTRAFAERLNEVSALQVQEAREGDRIVPGRALVAPGGQHMLVRRQGADLIASNRS
ncbi:MAG: response regulator, partial [Gemmatimonadales bacterium]